MTSYRRLYTALVSAIDDALGRLEEGRPEEARRILERSLLDAEDQVCTLDLVPDTDTDTDGTVLSFPGRP